MLRFAALAFIFGLAAQAQSPAPNACAALSNAKLPDTQILKAEQYDAGGFPVAADAPAAMVQAAKFLPSLCRVVALLTPTPDSSIKIELWMPAEHWNGRFRGVGNGGFAGEIDYRLIGLAVLNGYASAGTDTGHSANFLDATWAKGHPEKIADFGYRAIHLMTLRSKDLIAAYYGTAVKHSYFAACSDGGREALMEAQRFPTDYDGILAGAPAYNWTGLVTNALHNAQTLSASPESYLPSSKLPAVTAAVLASCDSPGHAQDGVSDGLLANPPACHFNPSTLICKAAESDSCLTAPQVKTLESIYAGTFSSDGKLIFHGYAFGGEADPGGWTPWITGSKPGQSLAFGFSNGFFSNMVFPDGKDAAAKPVDLKTEPIDAAYSAANVRTAADLNATNPDLKPFLAHGGKLILYHGWSDAAISPFSTIDYYNDLPSHTGKQATESSVRLYMAPGMDHCASGPGPDSFGQFGWIPTQGPDDPRRDMYLSLQQWVEDGKAPAEIIATKYAGDPSTTREIQQTRPLCPYPQIARYNGKGETSDAASFVCAASDR